MFSIDRVQQHQMLEKLAIHFQTVPANTDAHEVNQSEINYIFFHSFRGLFFLLFFYQTRMIEIEDD